MEKIREQLPGKVAALFFIRIEIWELKIIELHTPLKRLNNEIFNVTTANTSI